MNRHFPPLLIGMVIGLAIVMLAVTTTVLAAPLVGVPIQVTQPDGTILNCYATGDEYYNWMHDAEGYTIIQDQTSGFYVYADLVAGKLVPTTHIPGKVDPKTVGLEPNLNITPEEVLAIRSAFPKPANADGGPDPSAPTIGTINNLMVFIRFSGESEFTDTVASYSAMLNNTTAGASSVRNYFNEVSYNQLTISSGLYPTPPATTIVSYQDSHPRGYYQPYNLVTNTIGYTGGDNGTMRADREWTLLHDAIAYINSLVPAQFPSGASLDGDGDGYVDSITFVIYGSPTGWASLLWPHAWELYDHTIAINGKTVYGYNFHLQSSIGTGVLAHELFHVLGSPDLYHYSYDGLTPVGGWDVMQYDMDPPQHMGCYMKYMYGHWLTSIPTLTIPGTYSLNPLTSSTDNCFKIDSPNSATEFFVVEYRRPGTSVFEASLPGTGMLVYRINPAISGNAEGPPDEVYVYRPGGTTSTDGNVNQANFSSTVGRTEINDTTDPSSFLTSGGDGGLDLCNIGASGSTISFDLADCVSTDPPSAFNKSSPSDTAVDQITALTLDWSASAGASTYDYCLDAGTPDDGCDSGWVTGLTTSQVSLSLSPATTYEWQVRANNVIGTTYADGDPASYWTFTTGEASGVNLLQDPSFEDYPYTTYWDESSTNFGTPLCTVVDCGSGGGTAIPRTGLAWAWFGGIPVDETASVSQDVLIPAGANELSFYFWIGFADVGSDSADVFTAQIDGDTLFSANATQAGAYPSYTLITLDISSYADGGVHTVLFSSATTVQTVSFNLDDVAIEAPASTGDSYEPDNTYSQANVITSGVPQNHSIDPVGDNDWVTFSLTEESAVTLLTDGAEFYDTRLYLYDDSGSGLIEYDDDDAALDYYSLIDRECEVDALPAGTYFVMVDDYNNDNVIPAYQLDLTVTACGGTVGDTYEDDDVWSDANPITSGELQDHSIVPLGDVDWVTFTLLSPSAVVLETDGPAPTLDDTILTLFDGELTFINYNDDKSIEDHYSLLAFDCLAPLAAGTYYARAYEDGDDATLPAYQLELTVTPCGGDLEYNYLPMIVKPFPPPAAFGKSSPANLATGVALTPSLDWADSSGASSYEYCYDASVNGSCTGSWTTTGTTSQVSLPALPNSTAHEWQVRAKNSAGDITYADGGTLWSFTTAAAPVPWIVIKNENFETPLSGWNIVDNNDSTDGDYKPDRRNFPAHAHDGTWLGWPVGGGVNGSSLVMGSNYPIQADAWMVYGPFSTVGATAAMLDYYSWINTYDNADYFCALASSDNANFYGQCYYGNSGGWTSQYLDLANANGQNFLGLSNVYIAFQFKSDIINNAAVGAYIDDIVIKKCMAGSCVSSSPPSSPERTRLDASESPLNPFGKVSVQHVLRKLDQD
jgi:M6 family metalloprotease-like protein